jgi:hypothetical protein
MHLSLSFFIFLQIFFSMLSRIGGLGLSLATTTSKKRNSIIRVPESIWRAASKQHQSRIRELLEPGFLLEADPPVTKSRRKKQGHHQERPVDDWVKPLDPNNPVYNFLVEYYGLKGAKGPRRLARWSPSPGLLLSDKLEISSTEEFELASKLYATATTMTTSMDLQREPKSSIFLEGATEDDFAQTLHLRGATIVTPEDELLDQGVLYSPSTFYGKHDPEYADEAARSVTPFLWYKSILQQTLIAEPILHCHGLHEWAMQYQPPGAPPPPSGKYQSHLKLRVSRETITAAVERRGISCTHVDALRFFAPAAGPLNDHGASLQRTDQVKLEQPGCVHAHMDLLKIALKLKSFCDPILLERILEVALASRRLDVAASPYDSTGYGVGVVPIETEEGRAEYRKQQKALMKQAEPVRKDLLKAYDILLELAFDPSTIDRGVRNPQAQRFATSEPGSQPWRRNLIPSPDVSAQSS